jgi:hypothetical protein
MAKLESKMEEHDRIRCFQLRCKSKRGQYLHDTELQFLTLMFTVYPDEYTAMSREIFEATKPYGAI